MLRAHCLPLALLGTLLSLVASIAAEPQPLAFELRFPSALRAQPFTGRVLLFLGERAGGGDPRNGPNWFRPQPFFAMDVKDWQPDTPLLFRDHASFPRPLKELPAGSYVIQAVMDFDRGHREVGTAPGNAYSEAFRMNLDPKASGTLKVVIDQIVKERPFRQQDQVEYFEVESKLLSDFHKKPMKLRAGVALPDSYAKEPSRKYPIIYDIPGFGGNHHSVHAGARRRTKLDGEEFLYVVLDPDCRTGHHVFADSANNGPCGQALIEELIPSLEMKFRALGRPNARFVTGHSSGGWSSLWLQVAYPDNFGGCWSTAPDPVNFKDFQKINLYQPGTNMFRDEQGNERPLARGRGNAGGILYKSFSDMERVLGHGGQLASFEAVFSPKGEDGRPRQLWNRDTGAVDPQTAKAWEAYDIDLVLRRNWQALGPKLKGKIHVYMGERDTFYLEGATKLLQATLKELGSDAVVELFPGKDHGSLLDGPMMARLAKEMADQYRNGKTGDQPRSER